MIGRILWVLLVLTAGCTLRPVRTYEITARVTNDANHLLVVEGTTNLPDGAPVEAVLFDRDGRRLAFKQGSVAGGSYYVVLDVRRAPGFVPLTLEVAYDPLIAGALVTEETGPWGEAMNGEQVEESHGRCRLVSRTGVVLVVNTRQAAFRELRGEGNLRELQDYIARNPRDAEALAHLGLAYLKWRPAERRVGSRAHALLKRAVQIDPDTEMTVEARLWLSKLEADQRARAAERAYREALSTGPSGRYSTNSLIVPGEALGEVRLGMPLQALTRRFAPESLPELSGTGPVDVRFPGYHNLTVTIDQATSRVVSASSTSDFFRLPPGVGVGSLIQEFYPVYPRIPLVFGEPGVEPDGTRVSRGAVRLEGLWLLVERRTDPHFALPLDKVVEIGVLPTGEAP